MSIYTSIYNYTVYTLPVWNKGREHRLVNVVWLQELSGKSTFMLDLFCFPTNKWAGIHLTGQSVLWSRFFHRGFQAGLQIWISNILRDGKKNMKAPFFSHFSTMDFFCRSLLMYASPQNGQLYKTKKIHTLSADFG